MWDLHEWVTRGGLTSQAAAINNKGQIVGWATSGDRVNHGFFADLSTRRARHIPGEAESLVTAINNQNLAIGQFKYTGLIDHPLVWDVDADVVEDLNERLPPDLRPPNPSRWTLFEAWGVNDAGQITGFGTHVVEDEYHARAYRLTPMPSAAV
jgi:hypothetical protein